MKVTPAPGEHIILNGRLHTGAAQWLDLDNGTKVYVGNAKPSESSHFIGIVDPALPSAIVELMSDLLPRLMKHYVYRLPPLPQRPMLFISYDPLFTEGHGQQGGTLPGQVFMHFYGPGWETQELVGNTLADTAWFFAHEIGHLFQHDVTGVHDASWIHEGSAEAFAYLLLRSLGAVPEEYLTARRERAFAACRDALGKGNLASAATQGRFSDHYDCGLVIFLAIETAIRANSANQEDLFSFWTTLIADKNKGESWEHDNFLDAAQSAIGESLAERLRSLVSDEQNESATILRQLESL